MRVLICTLLALSFLSCKKYDEGPYVSIKKRKERVVNEWKVKKAEAKDGTDQSSDYDGEKWKLTRDHEYIWKSNDSSNYSLEGEWNFLYEQEKLRLDGSVLMPNKGEYEILRLKEKELWIKRESDGEEIHLEPQ